MENVNEQLKRKAIQKLNYKSPSPPPNIFFIRRNNDLLNQYLNDPIQLEKAMTNSPSEHRPGYALFCLDPVEKDITFKLLQQQKKKHFAQQHDPYFTKYARNYERVNQVIETDDFLDNIHTQLNFQDLRKYPKDAVQHRSKELQRKLCDKEHVYFRNQNDRKIDHWNKMTDEERVIEQQRRDEESKDM